MTSANVYHRIALYYDGTASGDRALTECARLAKRDGAEVMVFGVALPALNPGDIDDRALTMLSLARHRKQIERARRKLAASAVRVKIEVVQGTKEDEISNAVARFGADVLLIGERSKFGRALFGAIAPAIERRLSIPVMAVK